MTNLWFRTLFSPGHNKHAVKPRILLTGETEDVKLGRSHSEYARLQRSAVFMDSHIVLFLFLGYFCFSCSTPANLITSQSNL